VMTKVMVLAEAQLVVVVRLLEKIAVHFAV
jgi:hypothetical protein